MDNACVKPHPQESSHILRDLTGSSSLVESSAVRSIGLADIEYLDGKIKKEDRAGFGFRPQSTAR